MALIYVRSGAASPTSPYTSWATAAATLQDAINNAVPTNADTIWLAPDHAESVGSSQLWACPTTPGLRIMCAASNSVAPPTGLATTASLTTTSNTNQQMTGYAYVYGLNFNVGTTGNPTLILGNTVGLNACGLTFERCKFSLIATGSTALIQIGSSNTGGFGGAVFTKLLHCSFRTSHVGQYIRLYSNNILLDDVAIDAASSIPTSLFQIGSNAGVYTDIEIRNSDLTTKAYTNLFTVNGFQSSSKTVLRNSLIASGANLYTGTLTLPGGHSIRVHDCNVTDAYFSFAEHSAVGIASSELVVRRAGGAESSDSTTYSVKLAGSANATELYPLSTPEMAIWNTIIDTPITITMEILADRTTNLKNNEIWMEVAYPDDDANSFYDSFSDGRLTQTETATDQTASTATWTTTGITNIKKQKLEVTITASKIGFINVRACLGINTVVYVDTPTITE